MSQDRFTLRSAVYLIALKDDKILLSRRFKTGWKDGHYSLVSGHLDGDEPISDCMIREAKEEAGIDINKEDLIPAHVLHRYSEDNEYIDFFFITKRWKGEPKIMEPNKCDDLSWFSLDDLPDNLLQHVKHAIDKCNQKIPFSECDWK